MVSYWKRVKCEDCGEDIIVPRGFRKGRDAFRCGACHTNAVLRCTSMGPPVYVTRGK